MSAPQYGPPRINPNQAWYPPPQAPPRNKTAAVLAALLALIAGVGLGVLGGFFLFSQGDAETTTHGQTESIARGERDVRDACAIIERVKDETPLLDRETNEMLSDPLIFELTAAAQLLQGAGLTEEGHESISELGKDLFAALAMLKVEDANAAVSKIQEECASR